MNIISLTSFLLTLIIWKRMAGLGRRVDDLEWEVEDLEIRCKQSERREVALLEFFHGALTQAGFYERR